MSSEENVSSLPTQQLAIIKATYTSKEIVYLWTAFRSQRVAFCGGREKFTSYVYERSSALLEKRAILDHNGLSLGIDGEYLRHSIPKTDRANTRARTSGHSIPLCPDAAEFRSELYPRSERYG